MKVRPWYGVSAGPCKVAVQFSNEVEEGNAEIPGVGDIMRPASSDCNLNATISSCHLLAHSTRSSYLFVTLWASFFRAGANLDDSVALGIPGAAFCESSLKLIADPILPIVLPQPRRVGGGGDLHDVGDLGEVLREAAVSACKGGEQSPADLGLDAVVGRVGAVDEVVDDGLDNVVEGVIVEVEVAVGAGKGMGASWVKLDGAAYRTG